MAAVLGLGERFGAKLARDPRDLGVARHDPHAVEPCRGERAQDVAEHRARQRPTLRGAERGDESLLGVREILHGHGANEAHAPSTTRASAISRSRSVMSVSAATAVTPRRLSSSPSLASRRSMTSVRSHGA